ncbi:MAG: hypothetical protein ABSD57_08970 [Verrucomicrobiota bacterium]|jgi:Spy/CpxP family protein refolding chaperone
MNSWKIILATVVIFGCGVVTGGLLVNYVEHAHPEIRRPFAGPRHDRTDSQELQLPRSQMLNRQFVEQLDAALHLTPEQHEKIGKIIADGQEQTRHVMQDNWQRIRAKLTPEQRKKFEELMKHPPRRPPRFTNDPSALPPVNVPPDTPPGVPSPGA